MFVGRILAAVLMLSLVSCAEATTSPGGGGSGGGTEPTIKGVTWILSAASVPLVGPGDPGQARATILFDDDGAGGTSFCNLYGGTYTVGDDGALTIVPGAMTEMACEEPLMSLELAFVDALSKVTSYRFDGDSLVLVGDVELTFDAEQPTVLVGTKWRIDGLIDGEIASSVIAGTEPYLVLSEDGMNGDGGCNTFIAMYTLEDDALSFGPIESTEMACKEAGVMDQEAAILRALSSTAGYQIQGASLTLLDAQGVAVLMLVAA